MTRLDYSTQFIEEDDIEGVVDVLRGPTLAQGERVEAFEQSLCNYTGATYAIAFNSATSALLSAYSTCNISEGDEIITTPLSFVATSNMFVTLGAVPVWCDIKEDGNIDETAIEALITDKTKAIVPVHFAGKPVDIDAIHQIAQKYDLLVIEDGAHALGSSIGDKKIGGLSDMTIFSFHAIKPITTSEGGAVLTNNEAYAQKLKRIRSHGIVKTNIWNADMIEMGYNFRLTEVAGSLGVTQMQKLDRFITTRNEIATYYDERFKNETLFRTQKIETNQTSSRHLYPILLDESMHPFKEAIFDEFQAHEFGVQVHYKPIYQNSFYKERFGSFTCKRADAFFLSEISIPCHQKMNLGDAAHVADVVLQTIHKYAKLHKDQ